MPKRFYLNWGSLDLIHFDKLDMAPNNALMTFYLGKYLMLLVILSARYFIIAGSYFYFTQKLFVNKTKNAIVNSANQFKDQFKFELKYSMVTVFIFAIGGVNFIFAKESKFSQIYFDINEYGIAYFIFSIFLMLLINDVYFYWTHRALHIKKIFGKFHTIHHRSRVTTPWTSQSFHWVESVVNVFVAVLFPYLFPMHPAAYVIFTFIAFFNNIYGHGNYDFVPVRLRGKVPFSLLNSPSVHGFHHENVTGNYGLYTNIWDRLHGTYIDPATKQK